MNIFILTVFVMLNLLLAYKNYKLGNHKTSLFSAFVAGWCAMSLFTQLI